LFLDFILIILKKPCEKKTKKHDNTDVTDVTNNSTKTLNKNTYKRAKPNQPPLLKTKQKFNSREEARKESPVSDCSDVIEDSEYLEKWDSIQEEFIPMRNNRVKKEAVKEQNDSFLERCDSRDSLFNYLGSKSLQSASMCSGISISRMSTLSTGDVEVEDFDVFDIGDSNNPTQHSYSKRRSCKNLGRKSVSRFSSTAAVNTEGPKEDYKKFVLGKFI
jgi:hypothetical protein